MDETLYSRGHGMGAVVQLENLGSEILNESLTIRGLKYYSSKTYK